MKNNLLLTTALVALVATNANAASGASEITPETKWIGSGEVIETGENQSRDGGLLNFVNHKNTDEVIKDKTISGHIYQVNRTGTGTGDVHSQGSVLRMNSNSQIKGFENVVFSNNHAIATSNTPGTDQDKNKATATGGVIGVWNSSIDSISGKFVNNSAEVKYTGEGEYNGSKGESAGGGAIHIEGQYGNTDQLGFVGIKNINADFENNHAKGLSYANGGAIYMKAGADREANPGYDLVTTAIKGNFTNNSAEAITTNASAGATSGGAISIKRMSENSVNVNVEGNFSGNSVSTNATNALGGALYNGKGNGEVNVSNSSFSNNEAKSVSGSAFGGAIYNDLGATIDKIENTTFSNNVASSSNSAGGAIYNHAEKNKKVSGAGTINTIDKVTFENNMASYGGAIANKSDKDAVATINKISNSSFINNKATGANGGAILNEGKIALIENTTFDGNKAAAHGGAIYNFDKNSTMVIKNSTFKNNVAGGNGGAVLNETNANLTFEGTNTFENNTADKKANDIHNNANIVLAKDSHLILDGGISARGKKVQGEITLEENTQLTVKSGKTVIENNDITGASNATINMLVANGQAPEYQLVKDGTVDGKFKVAQNNLYNITDKGNGVFGVEIKGADELAQSIGANGNQANALGALTQANSNNETFNNVANTINEALQSTDANAKAQALNAVTALSPEAAPLVQQTQIESIRQVMSAIASRLSHGFNANEGKASGDSWLEKGAMWVQTLSGKSKMHTTSKSNGYNADNSGIAFGFEKQANDDVKVGVAYAYNKSDVDGFLRNTDVDTHSAILYTEYKPAEWFVNTALSYSWSDYSEDKSVLGNVVKADYDVEAFTWQSMTGYDFAWNNTLITPEAGLRYINYNQDSYRDTMGTKVGSDSADILTAVAGAKIRTAMELERGIILRPEARVAMTYDLATDSANASVLLANGGAYALKGERLDRVAVEFGAALRADINENTELSVAYEGTRRDGYDNNTGLVSLKYKF